MYWELLYPVVKEQAYYAVLRYEEPERRKDKIQELICQPYEKYQRDIASGKEILKQDYKCFVTQRAKEVDTRSFLKKGYGGTSTTDALSFYRRRPDSKTPVVEFDEWMTVSGRTKEKVEDIVLFNIDFKNWRNKLTKLQRQVLDFLIEGYNASVIAKMLKVTCSKVKDAITEIRQMFIKFFSYAIG